MVLLLDENVIALPVVIDVPPFTMTLVAVGDTIHAAIYFALNAGKFAYGPHTICALTIPTVLFES
jgi:hypothetical protein